MVCEVGHQHDRHVGDCLVRFDLSDDLQPVAIVINMNDPALNGAQALQTLKEGQELKRIPVLAFANHEEVDTWRKAKELGIDKIVSRNEFSSRTLALLEEVTHQASS